MGIVEQQVFLLGRQMYTFFKEQNEKEFFDQRSTNINTYMKECVHADDITLLGLVYWGIGTSA